jgi:hypothetical protein
MVATVQIVEKNGTSGTNTQKDSGTVRLKNADDATVDANNPMVVPTAGSDFSWEKWLRLKVTVAPDTNISNLKMYSDGTIGFGTGVTAYGKSVATYATPVEVTATAGYTDLASYTSGSALDLGTAAVTGTGEKGDHAVLMLKVDTNANPGALTPETITFSYDET